MCVQYAVVGRGQVSVIILTAVTSFGVVVDFNDAIVWLHFFLVLLLLPGMIEQKLVHTLLSL